MTEVDVQPLSARGFVPAFAPAEPPRDLRQQALILLASALLHVLFIAMAGPALRGSGPRYRTPQVAVEPARIRDATPLVAPPLTVLTQKAPNRARPADEFDLASLPPRPSRADVPASPGAAPVPRKQFTPPPAPPPQAGRNQVRTPTAAVPEAPQITPDQTRPDVIAPQSGLPQIAPPSSEPPKVAFERPGSLAGAPVGGGLGRGTIARPPGTVAEAARQAIRPSGRGLIVGDEDGATGSNPTPGAAAVPGKLGSSVELLSDPQGVDFWPYMMRVLSAVRRNWFAVIPESARFGRQGRTTIQFAIDKSGSVPKLVISGPSGTEALDRAAVASVSASNPFPPLPTEFKGSQIRLQFVFKYNVR